MFIESANLTNFKFLKEASLDFQKGFNLFVGDIGQGKSSFFNSISFLLFDDYGKSIEDLCNWDENFFDCDITLTHGNRKIISSAIYDKKTNKLERKLTVGREKLEGSTSVKGRLAELFDPALCKASMIHTQGVNDIVSAKPADRRENLKRVYNLDFSDKVESIDADIEVVEASKKKIEDKLFLAKNAKFIFKEAPAYPVPKDELDRIVKQLEEYEGIIHSIVEKKRAFDGKLFQRLEALGKIDTLQKNNDAYELKIKNKRIEIDRSNEFIALYPNMLATLQEEVDELKENLRVVTEEAEKEIASIVPPRTPVFDSNALLVAKKDHVEIQVKIQRCKDELKAMESGKCPHCNREYHTEDLEPKIVEREVLLARETVMANEVSRLEELKAKVDSSALEKAKLLEKKARLQSSLVSETNRIMLSIQDKENKIASTKSRIQSEKESIAEKESALSDYRAIIEGNNSAIAELKEKVKFLDLELACGAPTLDENMMIEHRQFKAIVEEYNKVSILIEEYARENAETERKQKENEKTIEELTKECDKLAETVTCLKRAQTIFKKEFPNYILSKMTKEIEDGMNSFLRDTYNARYSVKVKETSTGISIVYGKRDKDIEQASGAEKSLFQLAIKIAFTRIAGLKVLILDEIDSFMSTGISKTVFSTLNRKLEKNELEQIFVITHNDELKSFLEMEFGAKVFEAKNAKIL